MQEPAWINDVTYNADGLVPCIVQECGSADVLMMAWMNADSLRKTIATDQTWFWSRSRGELWNKGATSGNVQDVVSLHLDCDNDTILAMVDQTGPACHTGTATCWDSETETSGIPRHMLSALWKVVVQRDAERPEGSYTTRLLEGGVDRIGKKVGEEATEVVIAAKNAAEGRDKDELAAESADLLYHLLVLWKSVGLEPIRVFEKLSDRR